jgi:hypothetical protein
MLGLEGLESGIREASSKECVGRWLCPVMPGPKQHSALEIGWPRCLPGTERPSGCEVGSVWPGGLILFILWSLG